MDIIINVKWKSPRVGIIDAQITKYPELRYFPRIIAYRVYFPYNDTAQCMEKHHIEDFVVEDDLGKLSELKKKPL
jgi:hypothetical protein